MQLQQGPDGALYYLDLSFDEQASSFNAGTLRRVRFLGRRTNRPRSRVGDPLQGLPPLQVTFSSAGTADPDGDPITYSWAFGDGGTSTDANPTHTYSSSGQYQATLTVSDGKQTAFKSVLIRVGNSAGAGTILTPSNGTQFRAGDHISISGDATDAEDGTLPGQRLQLDGDLPPRHARPSRVSVRSSASGISPSTSRPRDTTSRGTRATRSFSR